MIGLKNLRIASLGVLLLPHLLHAMAEERIGPMKEDWKPPGQLKGLTALQFHPARVYSIWVNGNENFYFLADTQQVNQLLKLFAQVDMDKSDYQVWIPSEKKYTEKMLEMHKFQVRIASGAGQVKSFKDQVFEYNVALQVLDGIALWHYKEQLQKNPSSDKTILPRLTIHLGHEQFKWSDLKVPANVRLKDDRDIKIIGRKRRSEILPLQWDKPMHVNLFYPAVVNEAGRLVYPLTVETVLCRRQQDKLLCRLNLTENYLSTGLFRVGVQLLGAESPLQKEIDLDFRYRIAARIDNLFQQKQHEKVLTFGPIPQLSDIKQLVVSIERIEPWGDTTDGVQVRATARKDVYSEDESHDLYADIQNQGERKFLIAQHESYFEVAIDGKWFRWTGGLGLRSSPFGPGRRYDQIPIKLDPKHWLSLSDRQPLRLSPRRHQVQARLLLHDPEQHKVIAKVESNPLFIWTKKTFLVERKLYHGRVVFADGAPGVLPTQGRVQTHITLWHDDSKNGKFLTRAAKDGSFVAPLMDEEMAKLKNGSSFLTVNMVNAAQPRIIYDKTDTRFPVNLLTLEKEQAAAVTINPLPKFYGRLLFADEKPAVLDTLPWNGARIWVELFGDHEPDEQGYITVYLNKQQQQLLKEGKLDRKGYIYCPNQEQGSSTSVARFPANLLSPDKANAGVVHIPRPKYNLKPDLAKAAPLTGKPLPKWDGITIPFDPENNTDKRILICFWDMNQRPSRRVIRQLAQKENLFDSGNVSVIAVNTAAVKKSQLDEWTKKYQIPFPVGFLSGDLHDILFAWSVKAQPWLILTDQKHTVLAEGFPIEELDDKLSAKTF